MGGGGGIDWDPRHSALNTGAGLPWSAENKTKPDAYMLGLAGNVGSVPHDMIARPLLQRAGFELPAGITSGIQKDMGIGFDYEGQERVNAQADKQALAGQEAEAERGRQAQSAANEARRRAEDQTRRTQFGTSLQEAQQAGEGMDAYSQARRRAQQARGRTLYPGFM